MAFLNSTHGTTAGLLSATQTLKSTCDVSLLGTFTENHDLPRFASQTQDMALAKNALALTLLWDGIPIVYAGQEQHYNGLVDPANREATWLAGYDKQSELYKLTAAVNKVRNRALALDDNYATYNIWPIYNDTNTIALRKGFDDKQIISVFTNWGSSSTPSTLHLASTGWTPGTQVVEALSCDKATVGGDGILAVPMEGGLPRIYFSLSAVGGSGICAAKRTPNASSSERKMSCAAPGKIRKVVAVAGAVVAAAGTI
jgi:alpha-amylase